MTPNTSLRETGADRGGRVSATSLERPANGNAGRLRDYLRRQSTASLDGALLHRHPYRHVLRQARSVLVRGEPDPKCLPSAILRELLESISAEGHVVSPGGIVPVGPRTARLWWSPSLAGNDVLAGLDAPRMVARFYDITGLSRDGARWNQVFDIPLESAAGGQTLDFWASDREYLVELGLLHADGRYERLAGINPLSLPRDSHGDNGDGTTVWSRIASRTDPFFPELVPDAEARRWAAARPDFPERDLEAELAVHMLYRTFLEHGPAVLRYAPGPDRASPERLQEEFARRMRERREPPAVPARSRMVAVRFEGPAVLPAQSVVHPVVLAAVPWFSRLALLAADPADSFLNSGLGTIAYAGHAARLFQEWQNRLHSGRRTGPEAPAPVPAVAASTGALVQTCDLPVTEPIPAHSVFQEAEALRHRLAAFNAESLPSRQADVAALPPQAKAALTGPEIRRFTRSGARLTKVAFVLEGTVRPGTRLRIAGKTIQADKSGKFRVECPFNGRKTVIPIIADDGKGREAVGRVTIDWDKKVSAAPLALAAERT